jgi:MFS family permease
MFGALLLIPLYLQGVRGYGAFDTGLSLLPWAFGAAISMPFGGMLFDRIGARPLVLAGGALIVIAAIMLTTVDLTTSGPGLAVPLALYGVGMGLSMMPLNTHLINAAPRELVGRVTSLVNALQAVVNSFTVALLATILTSRITAEAPAAVKSVMSHAPHSAAAPTKAATALLQQHIQLQASVSGYDDTFKVVVVMAVVGTLMALVLRRYPEAHVSLRKAA